MTIKPVLLIPLLTNLVLSCEEGWTRFEKNCYKTFSEPSITNAEANSFCSSKHRANLSSVLSERERQFLVDFVTTSYEADDEYQLIIGGYRDSVQQPWKWYDGTPFTQNEFFRYPGEPTNKPGELYLSLMADHYKGNGPYGYFIDQPVDKAYLFVCKKKDIEGSSVCDDKWASFGNSCYRKFSNPGLTHCDEVNRYCTDFGSTLASVLSDEERKFIIEFSKLGRDKLDQLQPFIGGHRSSLSSPWQWYDGSPYKQYDMWMPNTPTSESNRFCMRIKADNPAYNSHSGRGPSGYFFDEEFQYKAYVFICKKKGLVCDTASMILDSGRCVCKPDFIDIVDSNYPEAKNYTRGHKCVKKGKCHSVIDTTSILFIIDSSESITAQHWPKMVNFVKQGAKELPNSFRVGFMKFSSKVSDKKWLEPNWNPSEYHEALPSQYEKGQTNTPLALEEARKMFKKDSNKNKIAVLITDGMHVASEYDGKDEALNATTKAARKLIKEGVRLTVMGVGPELYQGIGEVKKWVKNPKKDYLSFAETVDCLKESDMSKLLEIVCDSH